MVCDEYENDRLGVGPPTAGTIRRGTDQVKAPVWVDTSHVDAADSEVAV
jgi:hypothetical protein